MAQRSARIVATPDVLGGEPRIADRRIGVLQIHEEIEEHGVAPDAFAAKYGLDIVDVYHALAHYHDNVEEMTEAKRRREDAIATHRSDALTPDDRDAPTPK